jgi:hypothetical protein
VPHEVLWIASTVQIRPRVQLQCRSAVSTRKATDFPRGRGNGRRSEARQGAMRIFGSSWIRLQTAGQPWRGHHARRPCPCTSAVAGRSTRFWGCRERWKDRSAAGGHPHFFRGTFPASVPRDPPLRLHPMRDPANRPLARNPPRTLTVIRGPGFARSRIGASWGPAPVRLRQDVGAGQGRGWRDRYLPKNADGPLPRFYPSAVADASTHAWSNPRLSTCLTPFHCIVDHLALAGRDVQLQPYRR